MNMFICQILGKQSRPKRIERNRDGEDQYIPAEKPTYIVVRTRQREYRHWDQESEEEWFSHGSEIVKEVIASEEGVMVWNAMTPEQRDHFCKVKGW
jgi:hypothetical protein